MSEPRERPILFSGPMVRAILDGRKTETRRVVKPQPEDVDVPEEGFVDCDPEGYVWGRQRVMVRDMDGYADVDVDAWPFPESSPYRPGDLLYVRETHAMVPRTAYAQSTGVEQTVDPTDPAMAAVYRADWTRSAPGRWRPSIHMPKWAARIWLRVTDVAVERVQEITEEGARAEGIEGRDQPSYADDFIDLWRDYSKPPDPSEYPWFEGDPAASFRTLWDSLNADRGYGWDQDPWVWIVRFERTDAPND